MYSARHTLHLVPSWSRRRNIIFIYELGSAAPSPICLAMVKEKEYYLHRCARLGTLILSHHGQGDEILSPYMILARSCYLQYVSPWLKRMNIISIYVLSSVSSSQQICARLGLTTFNRYVLGSARHWFYLKVPSQEAILDCEVGGFG
ncbi:hypothetical protein ACE6H2_026356 [Prunus campanulata]